MKSKNTVKIISLISVVTILVGIFIIPANFRMEAQSDTENINQTINQILLWKYNGTIQDLLDNEISEDMGSNVADWYAIALSRYQNGLDFSSCIQALDSYTATAQNLKATEKQRIAIAYTAMGVSNDFVMSTLQETIGVLGLMSSVYGLILADCGAYTDLSCSREVILETLFSLQNADGGWALTGTVSDVDVTAMTVQALAGYYYDYERVKTSVDKALGLLSQRQQADGDFQSYGTANAESTAQVMLALNALNIDYQTDKRFIKNGKTVYDGMMKYQQTDGGFSHTVDTKSNALATVEVLCALVSIERYETNQSSFYVFVDRKIVLSWEKAPEISQTETSKNTSQTELPQTESSLPQECIQSSIIASEVSQKEIVSKQDTMVSQEESFAETSAELSIEEYSVSESAEPEMIVSESSAENESISSAANLSQTEKEAADSTPAVDGRLFVCIGVVGIFCVVLIIMIARKKANRKNLLAWAVVFIGVQAVIWTVNIQTKEDYYAVQESKDTAQTVTLSIVCSNAIGQTDNACLPANGVILDSTEIGFESGNTVFDVLLTAVKEHEIQLDYTGDSDAFVYIRGINYLYEFDCGELSGWMYRVNGKQPSVGCSSYVLNDGDVVEWIYTCNLGKDMTE